MRHAVPVNGDVIATHFGHCKKGTVEKSMLQILRRKKENATYSFYYR